MEKIDTTKSDIPTDELSNNIALLIETARKENAILKEINITLHRILNKLRA